MAGELSAMEEFENEVNRIINHMRRASFATDKRAAANHPAMRELAGTVRADDRDPRAAAQAAAVADADSPDEKTYTRSGIEGEANDLLAKMRSAVTDNAADPQFAANQPKLKELMHRLAVARGHFNGKMQAGLVEDDVELDVADPGVTAPGVPEPVERAETRPDVLSSPYAGQEPRYVVQHNGEPDPLATAMPTPPSEHAGARSPEEADLMREGEQAEGPRRTAVAGDAQRSAAQMQAAADRQRQADAQRTAQQREADAKRQAEARRETPTAKR